MELIVIISFNDNIISILFQNQELINIIQLEQKIKRVKSKMTNKLSEQYQKLVKSYKTQACQGCTMKCYPYYLNCSKFHSDIDKRRKPYESSGNILYDNVYLPSSQNKSHCINLIQYLFHPRVFRVFKCDKLACAEYFICPFYHNQLEKRLPSHNQVTISNMAENIKKCHEEFLSLQINNQEDAAAVQKIKKKFQETVKLRIQRQTFQMIVLPAQTPQLSQAPVQSPQKNQQNIKKAQNKNKTVYLQSSEPTYYTYGEKLQFVQDRHHQFKMLKNFTITQLIGLCMRYIVGFLNSEGGILYLGVNDQSLVHGISINQKQYDQLLLRIDIEGKSKTIPPLMPQKYKVRRVPVYTYQNRQLYVIQIKVKARQSSLTVYDKQCYMRMNASLQTLTILDVIQYQNINLQSNSRISQLTVEEMEAISIQQLSKYKKILQRSLQNIQKVLQKKVTNLT